jgi:hypothetical protein
MANKKRRTKEQIIRETFASAKSGRDLLPLMKYAAHEKFTKDHSAIRSGPYCPLAIVLQQVPGVPGGNYVWSGVRELLKPASHEDVDDNVLRALSEFVNAADAMHGYDVGLHNDIMNALGVEAVSEVENVG